MVEDEHDDERSRMYSRLKSDTQQGTIMKYCVNSEYLRKLTIARKNGGAEKDDGGGSSKTSDGSPVPDPDQSRTRGRKFWTKKAANSKKMGAKSRTWGGKQTKSDSSQLGSPGIKTFSP